MTIGRSRSQSLLLEFQLCALSVVDRLEFNTAFVDQLVNQEDELPLIGRTIVFLSLIQSLSIQSLELFGKRLSLANLGILAFQLCRDSCMLFS